MDVKESDSWLARLARSVKSVMLVSSVQSGQFSQASSVSSVQSVQFSQFSSVSLVCSSLVCLDHVGIDFVEHPPETNADCSVQYIHTYMYVWWGKHLLMHPPPSLRPTKLG